MFASSSGASTSSSRQKGLGLSWKMAKISADRCQRLLATGHDLD